MPFISEQLFLDDSSSHLAEEQRNLVARVNKLTPLMRVFGGASGALILVIAGIFIYQAMATAQQLLLTGKMARRVPFSLGSYFFIQPVGSNLRLCSR